MNMFAHEISPDFNSKRFTIKDYLTVTADKKLGYALILGSKDPNTELGRFEKIAVDQRRPPAMELQPWRDKSNRSRWSIRMAQYRQYALESGTVKVGLIAPDLKWVDSDNDQLLVRINTHMKGNPSELAREGTIDILTPSLAIRVADPAWHQFGAHKAQDWLLRLKPGAIVSIHCDHVGIRPVYVVYIDDELKLNPHMLPEPSPPPSRIHWLDTNPINATCTTFAGF